MFSGETIYKCYSDSTLVAYTPSGLLTHSTTDQVTQCKLTIPLSLATSETSRLQIDIGQDVALATFQGGDCLVTVSSEYARYT